MRSRDSLELAGSLAMGVTAVTRGRNLGYDSLVWGLVKSDCQSQLIFARGASESTKMSTRRSCAATICHG